jgi:uncharacterized protein YecE (DUF72 family)
MYAAGVSIHVGTSGWNYPSGRGTWNGVFYPARRPRGFDELAYYAEHFSTVEVNSTFYRSPDPPLVQSWINRTPASFGFSVKLFQKFTHPDMYLERHKAAEWDVTTGDLDLFRHGIEPLAQNARLLALLLQFPPSFQSEPNTREYLAWLLSRLRDYPLVVEVRHRSWSDHAAETREILSAAGAAWALIDEPKFESSIRQSMEEALLPGPLVYLRLHGRNSAAWWEHDTAEDRYNYLYSAAELAPVAASVTKASAAGKKVVAYFNNHFSSKAVANAAILKHQLGDIPRGEYPREMTDRYPELRGVVATSGLPL